MIKIVFRNIEKYILNIKIIYTPSINTVTILVYILAVCKNTLCRPVYEVCIVSELVF